MPTPMRPTPSFPKPLVALLSISTLEIPRQPTTNTQNVVVSSAEAKTREVFLNGQEIVHIRKILVVMDHPQPDNGNPLKFYSKNVVGISHSFIILKHFESWDIRYNWLEDRTKMGHLNHYWERGINN